MTRRSTKKVEGVELETQEPQAVEMEQAGDDKPAEEPAQDAKVEEPKTEEPQSTEPEQEQSAKKPPAKKAPRHQSKDLVRVRVNAEHGMLAGRAVFFGEVHKVMYYQYLEARETGGNAYELID